MKSGVFWRACAVWALVLGSIALVRSLLQQGEVEIRQVPPRVPFVGEAACLPPEVETTSGELIPNSGPQATDLLSCGRCFLSDLQARAPHVSRRPSPG